MVSLLFSDADRQYLKVAKAGDEVIIYRGKNVYFPSLRITTIERVTKTLVVVEGLRFRRVDGYEPDPDRGLGRFINVLAPTEARRIQALAAVTEFEIEEERRDLVSKINQHLKSDKASLAALRTAEAVLSRIDPVLEQTNGCLRTETTQYLS